MKIDFTNTKPDQILNENFLDDYYRSVDSIWQQLILLSSKLLILEKITAFRFDLFDENYPFGSFWNLAISSFYESSIMCIWRISIDNTNDEGITLNQLKNKIFQNFKSADLKEEFSKELKSIDFDKKVSITNNKITEIRHNFISHYNYAKYSFPTAINKLPLIYLDELKDVQSNIVRYFDILCFGETKSALPIAYSPDLIQPKENDNRIDIEKILDKIAENSYYIKCDEDEKEILEMNVKQFPKEDLEIINQYRKKFNKPEL